MHEIIIVAHKLHSSRGPGKSTIDRDTFLFSTGSVWDIPPAAHKDRNWHPAPFPTEIPRRLIELYTFSGDVVFDPFSGSGTTIQVARDLGRASVGIDLRMDYLRRCDWNRISLDYWRTGKAKQASDNRFHELPIFEELDKQ